MGTVRTLAASALAAGALALGLAVASPAHADSTNAQFVRDLRSAGFTNDGGDGSQLFLGHRFCTRMDEGESSASLVRELWRNSDLTHDQASQFVQIAINDLCPWS